MLTLSLAQVRESQPGADPNPTNPDSPHYNKNFYSPEYDDEAYNDLIQHFGREMPDELDFNDVWDTSYLNLVCPEYFYHSWFCGILYTAEPEVSTQSRYMFG